MSNFSEILADRSLIIAALHLPPFPGSGHPGSLPIIDIIDYALRNTNTAVDAGVKALYFQDLGDHPWAPKPQTYTIAGMSAVGDAIRQAFPDLLLGVCLMAHGGKEPIAIAQAIRAQFVRLKVYVGVMVKAEGILEGCAHEAMRYRSSIQAEDIAILADIHDRTGITIGEASLIEDARNAALFGRADGLILTGRSLVESLDMLKEVRAAELGVPLLLGGGANTGNINQALSHADGVIVSTAFKKIGGWKRDSLSEDWNSDLINDFMNYVKISD